MLHYLDVTDPAFRPDSAAVMAARSAHWCARTPVGFAVLRPVWRPAMGIAGPVTLPIRFRPET